VQPLFVFCADTHLADGSWASRPAISGDAYYSLTQIIDYCLQHALPLVIGGDVLDVKRNLASPVRILCEQMARMQAANLPVYYTQGQHELDRNTTWMSVHTWPKHVNQQTFVINGVKLWGIDWLPRGDIQTAFQQVPPDTDILVCHQVWKDLMKNIGRPECELSDVHYVRHVLTGDFHVTTIERGVNAQGEPVSLYSPGSTCMQDISEAQDKYFYVVGGGQQEFVVEPVQLRTRRFKAYTLTDQNSLDVFCTGGFSADVAQLVLSPLLPDGIDKPLVRVKFDKRLPDAHLRITTAVDKAAHLFCEALVDKSRGEQETNRAVAQNDLVAVIGELLDKNPAALKLATALLGAENSTAALEQQFAEFNEEKINAAIAAGSPKLVSA
jgi:hypothetical protein